MAGGGGKKGGAKITVYLYRMSVHMGVCWGPVDHIRGITIGEKVAWTGDQTTNGGISIDKQDLFGGDKKSGGVKGKAYALLGKDTQVLPDGLAARWTLTGAGAPGFRGVTSLFFVGSVDSNLGFYWTANQPFLQSVWIQVERMPKGLDPSLAKIGSAVPYDCNPAHIIYECLTNTDWGMGCPTTLLDTTAFTNSAQTLFDENLGLSMMWTQSDTIENFISEVLGHINGMVFTDPTTGLLTMKLLRGDYTVGDLPVINPDNAKLTNYSRKLYGETVNEIVVSYTNPDNEQSATVTVQDLANIAAQGQTVSDNRNYYGARNPTLAKQLGERELRMASLPIVGCEASLDRTLWSVKPGDVLNLVWPERSITQMPMRVLKTDYGRPTDPSIKVVLAQDIFGLAYADFEQQDGSEWVSEDQDPEPVDYSKVLTAPAFLLAQAFGDDFLTNTLQDSEVMAAILAASEIPVAWSYELYHTGISAIGTSDWVDLGTRDLVSSTTLSGALAAEARTTVGTSIFPPGTQNPVFTPDVDDFVFIGTGAEGQNEIAVVDSVDTVAGTYTLWRGLLDTVPQAWIAGTRAWFVRPNKGILDTTMRASGETPVYRLLTQTPNGILDIAAAPNLSATLTGRPHLPLRPANVTINGVAFSGVDATALTSVPVTWSRRNRLSETAQILAWDDPDTTPEVGQTTTLRVFDETGTLIGDIDGLTGTSYTLDLTAYSPHPSITVRVISKRDGLESLEGHDTDITLAAPGYGYGYGLNYGG